ncbi:phage tail protein [Leptolyngbya sp. AN03gr2]|uniref:phage tail protein n=1 Tax=unclassified Leptolyngbya TaxID=2650499 RepID=UPI003D310295
MFSRPRPQIRLSQRRQSAKSRPTTSDRLSHAFNYVTANRFYVEMESTLTACFSSCQGLSAKNNTTLLKEGGLNTRQQVLLGPVSYTEVTLSRGITDSLMFYQWLETSFSGGKKFQRRDVTILLFNQAGETMQAWTLVSAVPVGWKAPSFQASSTNLAIEELSLAFEELKVVKRK